MKLYIRINGLAPIVLKLPTVRSFESCCKIAEKYYAEVLFQNKPPVPITVVRMIEFSNGDKMLDYNRDMDVLNSQFHINNQEVLPIYEEPAACDLSATMAPDSDNPGRLVPKIISLNRLIMLLTDPVKDDYLLNVFWRTYRTFTKGIVVLKKLLQRFEIPDLSVETAGFPSCTLAHYSTHVKRQVQIRVLQVLYDWVTRFYFDFNDEMVHILDKFIKEKLMTQHYWFNICKDIIAAMHQTTRKEVWQREPRQKKVHNTKLNKMFGGMEFRISSASEKDVADTITYLDFKLYSEIFFTEFLNQAWNKKSRQHMAPNILKSIQFFNKISHWVVYCILSARDASERKLILKKFINILMELRKMNSFNMMIAVNAALNTSSISRLRDLWDSIDDKTLNIRREIDATLANPLRNWTHLREEMQNCYKNQVACCPYIGIFLTDLIFVDDSNQTFVDGKINFMKCIMTYKIMEKIIRFQPIPFKIAPNPQIMKSINEFQPLTEDQEYEMSLQIQPRK